MISLARTSRKVAALGALLAACSGGGGSKDAGPTAPTAPVLTTVIVSLAAATVQVGEPDTARAEGFDQRGAPIAIGTPTWTTASSTIATVNATGIVTGAVPGQTAVIATVGGKQGQAALVVVPVAVAAVTVSPPEDSAAPGQSLQLTATTLDAAGNSLTDRTLTWSSTETAVATVSGSGLVAALTAGTAIIVATSEGRSGAAVVTVTGALASGVVVSIAKPIAGQVVGDTLPVHMTAYSAYPISGVVASVGTQRMALASVGKAGWGGEMLLAGTLYGTFQLVLTATDDHNAIGVDSVEFVRKKLVLGGNTTVPGRKQLLPVAPKRVP
jgi:hypothetical protein